MVGKPNNLIPSVLLQSIPVASEPFEKIIIDCVGHLPRTILINDHGQYYPLSFKNNHCKKCGSLSSSFLHSCSHVGFPKVIQRDRGTNFTSDLLKEILRKLNASHEMSTAYHPQSQGRLEKFHQTFKYVKKRILLGTQSDWEENIDMLLLAIRECPQESLGYSPFELLYGRQIKGPQKILKDELISGVYFHPKQTVSQYLNNLTTHLSKVRKLAMENLAKSQKRMKTMYDVKTLKRKFEPEDFVLLFLPLYGNPLKSKYCGPYVVSHQLNKFNYVVYTPDGRKDTQLIHINLMKSYVGREENTPKLPVCAMSSNFSFPRGNKEAELTPSPGNPSNQEILSNLTSYLSHLTDYQISNISSVIKEFPKVTTNVLGYCGHTLHDILLINNEVRPIKQQLYRLNTQQKEAMKKEVGISTKTKFSRTKQLPLGLCMHIGPQT